MHRWRLYLADFTLFYVVVVACNGLGTAGQSNVVKGPKDFRSILESDPHPSIVRFDPLGCTDECQIFDHFWEQVGLHMGDRVFLWTLPCEYHYEFCKQRRLSPVGPSFAAWTNVEKFDNAQMTDDGTMAIGNWRFLFYNGGKDLTSLLQWIQIIAQVAPLKQPSFDASLDDAEQDVWDADTNNESCPNSEASTEFVRNTATVPPKITQNYGELLDEEYDNPLMALRMTILANAAFSGDLPLVQEILQLLPHMSPSGKETVIEHRNVNGATPLMLAAQQGHLNVVQCLIEQAGADVDAYDRLETTPLLAAVSLGRAQVVELLLEEGASIATATSQFSFSLARLAKQEGHADLAEFLAPIEDQLRREFSAENHDQELSSITSDTGLPPGMELAQCSIRMDLTHARCYLEGLAPFSCESNNAGSYYQMPTINAMTIFCESQTRCPFAPPGMIAKRMIDLLLEHDIPTYRLYSPPRDPETNAPLAWLKACQLGEDIWPCLFGQAEHVPSVDIDACRALCDLDSPQQAAVAKRDLVAVLTAAIVLQGNRTSPMLEPGPTLPPFDASPDATGITVSVHVRAGDSCDIVTTAANRTAWALWPFHPQGMRANDWPNAKRYCVHPQVHFSAIRALHKQTPIRRVLLATDSDEAYNLFDEELKVLDPTIELRALSFDRRAFGRPDGTALKMEDFWIEYRSARNATFAATAVATALEDIRLLSRGSLLIGAMCGMFAKAIHAAMVANNEKEIPVVSVDRCQPVCTEEGMEYL